MVFLARTGRLASGLADTSGVLDTSDIIIVIYYQKFIYHVKPGSISQLIKGKLRDLKKLLKYFNGTTTSCLIYYYQPVCTLFFLPYTLI